MTEIILLRGSRHEVHECITCGVVYTLPEAVANHSREQGGFHHCPSGHSQGWTKDKSEIERLRRERDRLKQNEARLIEEAREADQKLIKAEQATKRLKKRVAAGVCPCCKRTVRQLHDHMASKHPGYVAENVVPIGKRA